MGMYRVLKQFWYATDADAIKRLRAGETITMKERRNAVAHVGDVLNLPADIVRSLAGRSDGPYVEEVRHGKA